jgi:soluble lytic murein transglycosylase
LGGLLLTATSIIALFGATIAQADLFEQRAAYKSAKEKYAANQTKEADRLAETLKDYPLYPYLSYQRVQVRINHIGGDEIRAFWTENSKLPASQLVFNRWLKKQGAKRRWKTFLQYYSDSSSVELQCYYLRALYATGERTLALDKTTALWIAPKSQSKACDPIFAIWRTTPRFTEDVAWQRLHLAIQSNQRILARYLLRFFSGPRKRAAEAYYLVHTQPIKVTNHIDLNLDEELFRQVISHGLIKLSRREPEKSAKAWRRYKQTHSFSQSTKAAIENRLLVASAYEGKFPSRQLRDSINSDFAIQGLAEAALKLGKWSELIYWVNKLGTAESNKLRWQYWLARALEMTASENNSHRVKSREIFLRLATHRQYYGFLSAQKVGLPAQLNTNNDAAKTARNFKQIAERPDIARAMELFAVGDDLNGRREWYQAMGTMSPEALEQLAYLALKMGRLFLAIQTANTAEAFDDLQLRFPLAFTPVFDKAAHKNDIPTSLLRSIARQESAFQPTVVSSAGAQGLMQLMPATAKLAARRARLPKVRSGDLKSPTKNIALGSYHLAWLIRRYDGQRTLAIAAYNAGEGRVDRWIKNNNGVPADIWIESIPFKETRNYVKNVLAFNVVYSTLLGEPVNILKETEKSMRRP